MYNFKIDQQDIYKEDNFDGRLARPIVNLDVLKIIYNEVKADYLFDNKVMDNFLNKYFQWIKKSKTNNLIGIEKLNNLTYVHGTSQTFDFFFCQHKSKRLRCFKGDFAYHKVSWNSYFKGWKYIEDDDLKKGDAVVISVPYSDSGKIHKDTEYVLKICENLNIPVLIDCAYYSIAHNVDINLNHKCIESVTFSLSKPFYGAERLRIGMRCKKEYNDDGADLSNQFQQINRVGAGVGLALISEFGTDYIFNKYREKQISVCKKLDIMPSDCVVFGITDKNHSRFGNYDRGSDFRRVCISKMIGDNING